MAYYDSIAQNWHKSTGRQGGSFKKHVLNDILLQKMGGVSNKAILELGAGNGYFMRLVLKQFRGQIPRRLVITDLSGKLLAIAESTLNIPQAEYLQLDVRSTYPFPAQSFDLILATMLFNEVTSAGFRRALAECHRILQPDGLFLVTVIHPGFIARLNRQNLLKKNKQGLLTMPGTGQLRLPIIPRRKRDYERLLSKAGFTGQATDVCVTQKVISEKPGLSHMHNKPLALIFECQKE